MWKTFLFQTIQFSQTDLIQTIQFSISMQFGSIWPIDRALTGATIPGQSGPGSNGNKGMLRIPQISSITETSASDYPSPEVQSVYSTAPADWAKVIKNE